MSYESLLSQPSDIQSRVFLVELAHTDLDTKLGTSDSLRRLPGKNLRALGSFSQL